MPIEIITYKIKDIINLLDVPEIFYEINKYLIFFNINEEIIDSNELNESFAFNSIKKLIIAIAKMKKEKIYEDYKIFVNNKINGKDDITKNNIIKLLIDNNYNINLNMNYIYYESDI